MTFAPHCAWCGLSILSESVWRCRKCNKPICSPDLRDCGFEHYRARHEPQRRQIAEAASG